MRDGGRSHRTVTERSSGLLDAVGAYVLVSMATGSSATVPSILRVGLVAPRPWPTLVVDERDHDDPPGLLGVEERVREGATVARSTARTRARTKRGPSPGRSASYRVAASSSTRRARGRKRNVNERPTVRRRVHEPPALRGSSRGLAGARRAHAERRRPPRGRVPRRRPPGAMRPPSRRVRADRPRGGRAPGGGDPRRPTCAEGYHALPRSLRPVPRAHAV